MNKRAFTLIELLIIVSIIAILTTVIMVSLDRSKKNARINSAKSTLKSVMTTLVLCGVSGDTALLTPPSTVGGAICASSPGSTWPKLPGGYEIVIPGGIFSYNCNFQVDVGNDDPSGFLTCNCISQRCE